MIEGPMYRLIADKRPKKKFWAPGHYINRCIDCEQDFIGDKKAIQCADCAYKDTGVYATPIQNIG
jgi:hypothetical protein